MVETDTFTYSMNKLGNVPDRADESLITAERAQKRELSLHLLANLTQPLIICGPDGIGKTTLLHALQKSRVGVFKFCFIESHANLSFEALQEQVNRSNAKSHKNTGNQHKTVLLIDNAGALVPGLMTSILHYAYTNPLLRVVFALTHDDAQVKSRTDRIIDECHFIELPPLSEQQCGDFLRQLATQSWSRLPMTAIDDNMVKQVYRDTHGIPGKIINELPRLIVRKRSIATIWILLVAIATLIAVAFGIQWYSTSPYNVRKVDAPIEPKTTKPQWSDQPIKDDVSLAVPQPEPQPQQVKAVENPIATEANTASLLSAPTPTTSVEHSETKPALNSGTQSLPLATPNAQVAAPEATPEVTIAPVQPSQPVEPPQAPSVVASKESTQGAELPVSDAGMTWLNSQPSGNFTLQVMLLSKEQGIKDLQRKYPALSPDMQYIKTVISGHEKFLLFYGSFPSAAQATEAKQSLPREFRQALVKRIGAFKK